MIDHKTPECAVFILNSLGRLLLLCSLVILVRIRESQTGAAPSRRERLLMTAAPAVIFAAIFLVTAWYVWKPG